jgi:S1-C subfamily serine protease
VTTSDNNTYDAQLVGAAPDKDIAVLKIDEAGRYPPVAVGSSSDLRVGQKVFAIGNPFGLDFTLTTGVVSALNREVPTFGGRTIRGVIQTDAAINPGNSGGPLLDSAGRLIGVTAQIFSPSGASAGIGFAVPVDEVARVVPQLIAHGRVTRPGLGISIVPDAYVQRMGIEGVLIASVNAGSAAEAAGLRGTYRRQDGRVVLGDIILRIDDTPTPTSNDLLNALEECKVGQEVKVTVLRDRQSLPVEVTLQGVDS